MKKTGLLIFVLFLLVSAAFSGCMGRVYTGVVLKNETELQKDPSVPESKMILLGETMYDCRYDTGLRSDFTGKTAYRYRTGDRGRIVIDPETEEVIRFYGMTPLKCIDGAAELSDEELLKAVSNRLACVTDMSAYNTHSIEKNSMDGKNVTSIIVGFYEEKDGLRHNNFVMTVLDGEGNIENYMKIAACPEGTPIPEVSDEERDRIILRAIKKELSLDDPGSIEIQDERLTLYNGKPALLFVVNVHDRQGFGYGTLTVVVY